MRLRNLPSSVYLWLAIFIFAASSSVTRRLINLGEQHLLNDRNPISSCNVLFVGNLCALLVLLPLFIRHWNRNNLARLKRGDWLAMAVTAVLASAIAPGLFFMALEKTMVTNVVLISRLETPLTLILSVIFLGERVNVWTAMGSLVSFCGVVVTAVLTNSTATMKMGGSGLIIGQGELMAAIAAIFLSISTLISQSRLQQIPLGIFTIFRTTLGTIFFFTLAIKLFGMAHFAEAFSPFLWQWMLLYGGLIVVGGQLCWFTALKGATSAEIAIASSFNPIAAIAIAFLLLGEVPTQSQLLGGSLIVLGIAIGLVSRLRQRSSRETPVDTVNSFKGV
ncbi:DMT family transporter [Oscillatoria sp. FACHB-1406]|uniref:DMT family transporter n=1 Tax=Oscillatoria sp. FACHB-1406 TaxID=2692846 RepID=UPI0016863E64|nr:DMT family transporter [Oscillatoria sp. FACHB-1406]MBD2577652.1 DMT family transporter [Oscillatoria sp. FACHB-1406]